MAQRESRIYMKVILMRRKAEELWDAINMARHQPPHTLGEPHFNHHYINIAL